MKKKILTSFILMMLITIALIPFAVAESWEPKNNVETFQDYLATAQPSIGTNPELNFVPSEEDPNKVIYTYNENIVSYTIEIGDNTYTLWDGTTGDFAYTGSVRMTLWNPDMSGPITPFTPCRKIAFTIKYMFDFSAVEGGIDGTLEMQLITKGDTFPDTQAPGAMTITSLQGTGDLQNVNIKATSGLLPFTQMGIVSGWPE